MTNKITRPENLEALAGRFSEFLESRKALADEAPVSENLTTGDLRAALTIISENRKTNLIAKLRDERNAAQIDAKAARRDHDEMAKNFHAAESARANDAAELNALREQNVILTDQIEALRKVKRVDHDEIERLRAGVPVAKKTRAKK